MRETVIREAICAAARRLYAGGYITATDGNITARLDEKHLIATPSGVVKPDLTPEQLVVIDYLGVPVESERGKKRVTSEIRLHLPWYRERAEVHAVVHAHPPFAVACSLCGIALDKPYMPEMMLSLGMVPTAPYATPGTDELPASIARYVPSHNAVILARHGSVTVGADVASAVYMVERLDWTAKVMLHAFGAAGAARVPTPMSDNEVAAYLPTCIGAGVDPRRLP